MNIYLTEMTNKLARIYYQNFEMDPMLFNDNVKNKGYGTQSEILAIQYAFKDLKLDTVYADAIHKNTRSQRVLSKVGFCETHRDHTFIYYRCDRSCWAAENEPGQV